MSPLLAETDGVLGAMQVDRRRRSRRCTWEASPGRDGSLSLQAGKRIAAPRRCHLDTGYSLAKIAS